MKILVLNAGSSSQKSCLYEFKAEELPIPSRPIWEADIDWSHRPGLAELKVATAQGGSLEEVLKSESRSAAIGHMLRTLWSGPTKVISEPDAIAAGGFDDGESLRLNRSRPDPAFVAATKLPR